MKEPKKLLEKQRMKTKEIEEIKKNKEEWNNLKRRKENM